MEATVPPLSWRIRGVSGRTIEQKSAPDFKLPQGAYKLVVTSQDLVAMFETSYRARGIKTFDVEPALLPEFEKLVASATLR